VIDFTYLDVRDGDIVVKELAAVDFHRNIVSSYIFKKPYVWEAVSLFSAQMNETVDHRYNWNDGDIPYSKLENVLYREASSAFAIYCYGPQQQNLLANLSNVQLLISPS
jgi:hypothetical protein